MKIDTEISIPWYKKTDSQIKISILIQKKVVVLFINTVSAFWYRIGISITSLNITLYWTKISGIKHHYCPDSVNFPSVCMSCDSVLSRLSLCYFVVTTDLGLIVDRFISSLWVTCLCPHRFHLCLIISSPFLYVYPCLCSHFYVNDLACPFFGSLDRFFCTFVWFLLLSHVSASE